MIDRDMLERMIETAIRVSPIALTAGGLLRVITNATGFEPASRSTVQRIADRMAAEETIRVELRTVEVNGYIKEGVRHYVKNFDRADRVQAFATEAT